VQIKLEDWITLLLGLFLIGSISACSSVKIDSDNMPKDVPFSTCPGAVPEYYTVGRTGKCLTYFSMGNIATIKEWYSHTIHNKHWKITREAGQWPEFWVMEAKKGDETVVIGITQLSTKIQIRVTWNKSTTPK